jgi:hypothetical protein
MIVKEIRDEDFTSYKKPSMVIGFPSCTFKCERECGYKGMCQNLTLATAPDVEMGYEHIVDRYMNNPITKAIIMAGLEPFDSLSDLIDLIRYFRAKTNDDIIVYTGYTEEEIKNMQHTIHYSWGKQTYSYLGEIAKYPNIIIKYGRYKPNEEPHYDAILGIKLASSNQYAVRIS